LLIYGNVLRQEKVDTLSTSFAPKIDSLFYYPIKGLSGVQIKHAILATDQGMPFDRAYAIENGGTRFDAQNPKWLPKVVFLQLMRNERLASLDLLFDEGTHTLILFRDGKQVAKGALQTKLGRQLIEQFLSAYMSTELRGPPRIVHADGHSVTDIAAKAVHIVNLETVREVGRVAGLDLDPRRFRANLYLEGFPAWEERKWVGQSIACGEVQLAVFDETGRCEATSVDPKTAQRRISIPATIERTWGHSNLGVYAKVKRGGDISTGDEIAICF
jgi:hypothetical protein